MKKPKRISSKRPSLWMTKDTNQVRIFYPSGKVEFYNNFGEEWLRSYFSKSNPKLAIQSLKFGHTFLGYL